MKRLALTSLLLVAACASVPKEPPVRIVETKVPVARECVPKSLPDEPFYPDTDAALRAAPAAADRYQLMAAGRLLRVQRAAETEPVIKACR